MATIIATAAIPLIKEIFDKFIPDPIQKAQAALELAQLQQQADFKQIDTQAAVDKSQSDVNAIEAASPNIFVSGWRPFVGWVCGAGFAYQIILEPLLKFMWAASGHPVLLPSFDSVLLGEVMCGMLGMGGMRTFEKIKGVSK